MKQATATSAEASWTTAIGTAVCSPAMPTSGEATAPMRKEQVPSRADAEPAACRVRIRARAWVLGRARPIADIRTNSAAATGASPTWPKTPVDIRSRAVAASVMTPRPTARTRSRPTRPTRTLPLI
uniref:Uncharacterized protein n=1 Tax=Streptomyces avermitilis TaxID=33903 RepID=A0A499VPM7_STRAX|nr:hypothetical protein SAVMC3_67470 [Streptomyces avermitilis]